MSWRSPALLLLTSALLLAGCNAAHSPAVVVVTSPPVALEATQLRWILPAPGDVPLEIRGVVDMDDAGLGGGAAMYPGGNAGTFLVAIFTHAAIADAAQDSQKAKLQAQADKVLTPYLPILDGLKYRDVMQSAVPQMIVDGEKILIDSPGALEEGWLATIEPVFLLTQDERAILMESVVTLFAPDERDAPYYRNIVRVVSLPLPSEDPEKHWLEANGERFRAQLASLVAHGLDVAITNAITQRPAIEEVHRTFRYREGSVERMERAQLLERTCNRLLLKTLRGHLYLVPAMVTAVAETSPAVTCNADMKSPDLAG